MSLVSFLYFPPYLDNNILAKVIGSSSKNTGPCPQLSYSLVGESKGPGNMSACAHSVNCPGRSSSLSLGFHLSHERPGPTIKGVIPTLKSKHSGAVASLHVPGRGDKSNLRSLSLINAGTVHIGMKAGPSPFFSFAPRRLSCF